MLSDKGRRDNALIGIPSTCSLNLRLSASSAAQDAGGGTRPASWDGKGPYYEPSKLRSQPMARMNWRRAQLYGRRTLDHRYENDAPDAAERWLRRAEHLARVARMRSRGRPSTMSFQCFEGRRLARRSNHHHGRTTPTATPRARPNYGKTTPECPMAAGPGPQYPSLRSIEAIGLNEQFTGVNEQVRGRGQCD
jgi:hypothetical protein